MYFLRGIGAMAMTIDQAHDFYTADNIKTIIVAAFISSNRNNVT